MLSVTKIYRFESAHAINGYEGKCQRVHGHSYELHVTMAHQNPVNDFIDRQGILIDFKEIKNLSKDAVNHFDHKLLLSTKYLETFPHLLNDEALITLDVEPTAENLLILIRNQILQTLPKGYVLKKLVLWETHDSYASWSTT